MHAFANLPLGDLNSTLSISMDDIFTCEGPLKFNSIRTDDLRRHFMVIQYITLRLWIIQIWKDEEKALCLEKNESSQGRLCEIK